jgi:hypothetical protein
MLKPSWTPRVSGSELVILCRRGYRWCKGLFFQMSRLKRGPMDTESEISSRSHIPRIGDPTCPKQIRSSSKRFVSAS